MRWKDRLEELKTLVNKDWSDGDLAAFYKTTISAIEHVRCRYNIKKPLQVKDVTQEQSNQDDMNFEEAYKIPKKKISEITNIMGSHLLEYIKRKDFKLQDVKLLRRFNKNKKVEESILDLSDIHIGMTNKVYDSKLGEQRTTYNHDIFKKEMVNLKQSIFEIHNLLSHAYSLKHLNVFMLGDVITNDRIFSGQEFHIDRCVGEQMWEAAAELFVFINNLKALYESIDVTCVVGNHGRSTSNWKEDEPVQNNFEYHVYKIMELMFKDDTRIKIKVPVTRQFIVDVAGWKHLIQHGDTFRGTSKNYIERQVKDLFVNVGNFDIIDMGHFHTCEETQISENVFVKHNGSFIEKDNYAFRVFKQYSVPSQWFYGCNSKRRETWAYKIDLRV